MANRFPEVRINLVEQDGWGPWDSGGILAERASDAANEDFHYMPLHDVKNLIEEMAGNELTSGWTGPKEWSPRKKTITDEEFEGLAERVKKGESDVETVRYSILDALTWMYEIAMTPNNGDIRDAMTRTVDYMVSNYEVDEELWEPIIGEGYQEWNESGIVRALSNSVQFVREPDHYDRYLVFDFSLSHPVVELLKKSKWSKKVLDSRLKREFFRFQTIYMDLFFDYLKEEFKDVDITNRTDWKKQWRNMLSDKEQITSVRKEILQATRKIGGR